MTANSLELWGGYECTVNRVQDAWFDQTPRSGHKDRLSDLALFSDLGMRSLRYPVLWESVSPDRPDQHDFAWADERLAEIRRLGMDPILTLCHHGSGPAYTSLIDDSFAPGLAKHARAVAQRFPWVRDYTPVNEPLTTARFSALYGYWYPHTKDEGLFWTALLNEIDATRLAMREIRQVNPDARLIQTDDLGFCHATPPLQSEADYQNERRWIGWDLLCGTVRPGHKLWDRLAGFGLAERLQVIADDPCPPDVIGINHYLASERLLDHDIARHGNRAVADRELGLCEDTPFVDVDAIRTRREGTLGLPELIRQAWQRYGRAISITECHNGATREEQIRWFAEVWEGALALREEGVDLCSVTAWSLLGAYDWHRMVTSVIGHYEPGVFDVRSGQPRPTALAGVLRALAAGERPTGPWAGALGWWRRDTRFIDAEPSLSPRFELSIGETSPTGLPPLVIFGSDGPLTELAIRACETRALHYVRLWPDQREALDLVSPWAVLDTHDRDGLSGGEIRASVPGVDRRFDQACARRGIPIARIGRDHAPEPTADTLVSIAADPIFWPGAEDSPAVEWLDALDGGKAVEASAAAMWDRSYGPDVIDTTLDLLLDGATGQHMLRAAPVTHAQFARALAEAADADPTLVLQIGAMPANDGATAATTLLLPPESTAERFVRERRFARLLRDGMEDGDYAPMLQAAE